MAKKNAMRPVHPGEIIKEDILPGVGLSVTAAAKALGISRQMLYAILAERRPLSAVMCLKILRLFGSTPEFWMRLQASSFVIPLRILAEYRSRRIFPDSASGRSSGPATSPTLLKIQFFKKVRDFTVKSPFSVLQKDFSISPSLLSMRKP